MHLTARRWSRLQTHLQNLKSRSLIQSFCQLFESMLVMQICWERCPKCFVTDHDTHLNQSHPFASWALQNIHPQIGTTPRGFKSSRQASLFIEPWSDYCLQLSFFRSLLLNKNYYVTIEDTPWWLQMRWISYFQFLHKKAELGQGKRPTHTPLGETWIHWHWIK